MGKGPRRPVMPRVVRSCDGLTLMARTASLGQATSTSWLRLDHLRVTDENPFEGAIRSSIRHIELHFPRKDVDCSRLATSDHGTSYPVARAPEQLGRTCNWSRFSPGSHRWMNSSSGTSTASKSAPAGTVWTTRSARLRCDQNGMARWPSPSSGAGTPFASRTVHTEPHLDTSAQKEAAWAALRPMANMLADPRPYRTTLPRLRCHRQQTSAAFGRSSRL